VLPALAGKPIRVRMRPWLGQHLAATSIPKRVILLERSVLTRRREFERILVHELFHFSWVRLSNRTRRSWELLLSAEIARKAGGELGWSSESRKRRLVDSDVSQRTKAWRHYACESFCDTAACLFAGLKQHDEFTLPAVSRQRRKAWFEKHLLPGPVLV